MIIFNADRVRAIEPIDYLIIGHVTQDLTKKGPVLGGTVSYSAKTARALGLRVGIVTSCAEGIDLSELDDIPVVGEPAEHSSTFENIITPQGRIQYVHHTAHTIDASFVPVTWLSTPVVHLGPVCREIDPGIIKAFQHSFIGLTPQGWFRTWDEKGLVRFTDWPEASFVLRQADAAVLSVEDVQKNEDVIQELASSIKTLVVTEGYYGARIYHEGDLYRVDAPHKEEVDPTGAGDIFATSFFSHFTRFNNPLQAAQFATLIAANSVTRPGLKGTPSVEEVFEFTAELQTKR